LKVLSYFLAPFTVMRQDLSTIMEVRSQGPAWHLQGQSWIHSGFPSWERSRVRAAKSSEILYPGESDFRIAPTWVSSSLEALNLRNAVISFSCSVLIRCLQAKTRAAKRLACSCLKSCSQPRSVSTVSNKSTK